MKEEKRELRLPGEGEMLGVISRLLGYDRLEVKCADGHVRVARIPGRFKKKLWFREGDVILIAPWDFQPKNKADVLWRYEREEVKELQKMGLLKFMEETI
ncbi:MAG: translation initiation factor aIF-1A [Candidatus Nezhaarchaeales archaeon]